MKSRKIIFGLLIFFLLLACIITLYSISSSNFLLFRKYVLSPAPRTVEIIGSDIKRASFGSDRSVVLYFKISKADLELVLKSRAFKKYEAIGFSGRNLYWGDNHPMVRGDNIALYWHKDPPHWFKPNDWDNPAVYSFQEKWGKARRDHTKIIIYNEERAEAYFIDHLKGD